MTKSKKDKKVSLQELDVKKLQEKLILNKKELFSLRCQKSLEGSVSDSSKFSKARKEIARINTELAKRK